MHESAIRFNPVGNFGLAVFLSRLTTLFSRVEWLARSEKVEAQLYMQHNLRRDVFAVVVECGPHTFSGVEKDPADSLETVNKAIKDYLNAKDRSAAEKSLAGTASRKGTGRVRPEGKRRKHVRKG